MENQFKAFTVFVACLGGILTGAKAIVRDTSLFVMGLIGLLAEGAFSNSIRRITLSSVSSGNPVAAAST